VWRIFVRGFRGCVVLLDKGYVDEGFAEVMRARGCGYKEG
jgi:hypothetical protein